MYYSTLYRSIVGDLRIIADETSLLSIKFDGERPFPYAFAETPDKITDLTKIWLDEYFSGGVPTFSLPVKFAGSPFRVAVWEEIARIPYGETTTYGAVARAVAKKLGKPKMSAQAVGGAVGKNPIPIVVPCHRVMGADGSLTGFSAGLDKKKILLDLEKIVYKDK